MGYLDGLNLTGSTRQQIEENLSAIRANNLRTIILRIENGHRLNTIKTLIGHGGWLTWLVDEADAGYGSPRSAERDMALADHLYERREEIAALQERTFVTALYELCRGGAPDGALDTAIEMMRNGERVTPAAARDLTLVMERSPDLSAKVKAGEITLSDAAALLRAIESAPAAVAAVAVEHRVKPALVETLTALHRDAPERFAEVAASGSIYNAATEQEVPLSEASRADATLLLDDEKAEREARRRQHIEAWREGKGERLFAQAGSREEIIMLLQSQIPPGMRVRVYVYPDEAGQNQNQMGQHQHIG